MTGEDLIAQIKNKGLIKCEILVQFSFKMDAAFVVPIENVGIDAGSTGLIEIGSVDELIKNK